MVALEAAAVIRLKGRHAAESIVAIGEQLARVKEALGHGHYLGWLHVEFGWSDDTAERFRNVHKLAGRIPQIAEYQVDVSALYLLAKPSTPEPVREAALEKAAAGERVTHAALKDAIREEKGRIERAFAPKAADEEIRADPVRPDPEKQAAFALSSAVGGRLRDIEQIMAAHSPRDVAWAVETSPLGSAARFLPPARAVAAWLGEIVDLMEKSDVEAA